MEMNYKIFGSFDEECAQMVPAVDNFSSTAEFPQQWSPYSSTASYDGQNFNDAWSDVGGSPCPAGAEDFGQSVPVYGQQQPQAYTFDGQLVKAEPVTLLDCLKAPLPTDQYNSMYQQKLIQEDARVKMEETCRLAQQIAYSDVSAACRALRISPDPLKWTVKNTREWLMWTCQQYKECGLSVSHLDHRLFEMDGLTLSLMTEEDFKGIQYGEMLLWALEIWKGANEALKMEQGSSDCHYMQMSSPVSVNDAYSTASESIIYGQNYAASSVGSSSGRQSYCFDTLSVSSPGSIPDSGLDGCGSEDGDIECFDAPSTGKSTGSHTHLWQFLKEMLANPRYKSAIRWTDRGQGIFKIDDSGLVARKWGERKHRPAMNYDKLSRSIRQYYKKGIMKKTARSQRLVYQFCSHYAN